MEAKALAGTKIGFINHYRCSDYVFIVSSCLSLRRLRQEKLRFCQMI